ncbi:MAG: hypothetical protein KGY45_04570 [Hadesarchaea archaeon]|nr:hypothetical protein [Hadesarchaea archaeon]
MNEKNEEELVNKISDWLRMPETNSSGAKISRGFFGGLAGGSKLTELCKWIKKQGYSRSDVKKILNKYQHQELGGEEMGFQRDAGGKSRFNKMKRKLLQKIPK